MNNPLCHACDPAKESMEGRFNMEGSQVRRLIQRAQKGDESARNELVVAHQGLVVHYAKRYWRQGAFMDLDDLRQQGCLGLILAIQKFNIHQKSRGRLVRFATYARYWIEHAIRREIEKHGRTVAMPSHIQWLIHSVEKANQKGRLDYGPAWDRKTLARTLGVTPQQLQRLDHAVRGTVPLEASSEDEESFPRRLPVDPTEVDELERAFARGQQLGRVKRLIRRLPPRERYILERYYGLTQEKTPMVLRVIGRKLSVSEERARQLKRRALLRMRKLLQGHEADATALSKIPRRQWVPMVAAWL